MTEIIGDVVQPIELVLPTKTATTSPSKQGELFLSGSKLWFYTGSAFEVVTSA